MKSLYIASSHSFQEQIPEPKLSECENRDEYMTAVNVWAVQQAMMRTIPCRPSDKWEEGVLYEEGRDYLVVTFTPSDCAPSFFIPPDDLPVEIVIIPFTARSSEPPTTEEAELWKEIVASVAKEFYDLSAAIAEANNEKAQQIRSNLLDRLLAQYKLSRRSEQNSVAIEFAVWVATSDYFWDDDNRWIHTNPDENPLTDSEIFQLFKKQKP